MKIKSLINWFSGLYSFLIGIGLLLPKKIFAAVASAPIDPLVNCRNFKAQFYGAFNWVPERYCTSSGVALFVIQLVVNLAGIAAVIWLTIGGFLYMTSSGSEEQIEKSKKIIINAIIGLVIIIMAGAIVRIIANLITT